MNRQTLGLPDKAIVVGVIGEERDYIVEKEGRNLKVAAGCSSSTLQFGGGRREGGESTKRLRARSKGTPLLQLPYDRQA